MKKRAVLAAALLLAAVLLLTACGAANYTISGTGTKTNITVQNAKDDAYGETDVMSVGKDRTIVVTSALEKGQLKIEFMEVAVFHEDDGPDDITKLDVAATVTVGPGETKEVSVPAGDYVYQLTTVGETNGKVTVEITKK